MVDGTYEEAVARAASDGADAGCFELADVGASGPAEWVIDGYATLFSELPPDWSRRAGAGRRRARWARRRRAGARRPACR